MFGIYAILFGVYFLIHCKNAIIIQGSIHLTDNFYFNIKDEIIYTITLLIPLVYIYVFNLSDIKENISKPLFTKVHLSNEITADNTTKRLPEFNIKVTAYAVQAEGVSVEEAKNSLLEMSIVRED